MADATGRVEAITRLGDNSKHCGETERAAFSFFFRREERFEYVRLGLAVHPTPCIAHRQLYIGAGNQRAEMMDGAAGKFNLGSFNRENSSFRHRVSCIDDEIHENLLKLCLVGAYVDVSRVK